MEVQHFDKNGNKINQNFQNNGLGTIQDNNPKIIHHNRLNNLPIVEMNFNETKEESIKKSFVNENKDVSLQTKITKEKSKYEIDKETTFTIELGVMFNEEQIIVIPKEKFEEVDSIGVDLYEKHWVKFRLWNFLEAMTWKQECMEFLQEYRIFNLNTNNFNELKVRRLLLDWSFKDYGDDNKLFHINGQLIDESMNLFFKKFNPNIIQYIVNKMNYFLGEY